MAVELRGAPVIDRTAPPDSAKVDTGPAKLILRKASNVTPRQTTWAWLHRIPLSAVSLLAGREGPGKSKTMIEPPLFNGTVAPSFT